MKTTRFMLCLLVSFVWCGKLNVTLADELNDVKAAAQTFYEYLQEKNFSAAWQMLSTQSAKMESQKRYVLRLSRSTKNLKLESFELLSSREIADDPKYIEIGAELTFVLERRPDSATKEYHRSTHFTLWFREGKKWVLHDERSLGVKTHPSQLKAWDIVQGRSVRLVAVGPTQNQSSGEIDTLWVADEKNGNPYLRIGMEAGVFLKNRINLRIRDIEPSQLRYLSKILTGDTMVAHVSLRNINASRIPGNVRLVSFAGGTYGTILSSDPRILNWTDFAGRTVGVAGFSETQVDLLQERLRVEFKSKFSPTTLVNVKDATSQDLPRALKQEDIAVLFLHPNSTPKYTESHYRIIGNLRQPSSAIFMTNDLLGNSELAERFLLSHFESMKYFRTNRTSVIAELMAKSPDLKISEAIRLYGNYSRELPTQPVDIIPTLRDISLYTHLTQAGQPSKREELAASINPDLVGSARLQRAMLAPNLP
jgi:hypothetical protein